jgi:hypothetical protein
VALAIVGSAIWVLVHVALGAHFALAAINAVESSQKQPLKSSTALEACGLTGQAWFWLNDPIVSTFELLPIAGQDLGAIRTIIGGVSEVCKPATKLVVAFDETNLLASIHSLDPVTSRNLSLDTLKRFDAAEVRILALNATNLHFGLSSKVAAAQRVFARIKLLEPDIKSLVSVGAAVLSKSGSNLWLIATQNLAEARGTGGILGSYAVVRFDDTGPHLEEAGSDKTLANYGPVVYESLPVDTATIWGVEPGLWQDMNPSMHAPYAAKQIYDSWLKYKGQKLAGIIFIGQGWAQDLVALVGGVVVDGARHDGSNTAEFLAKGIYSKYPDVTKKNAFIKRLMEQLGSKLTSANVDFKGLLKALEGNRTGDKLFAWSADSKTEANLIADEAAGDVDSRLGNRVWVGINNGGGNKIDAYLKTSVNYFVNIQKKGSSESRLVVTLENMAPKAGLPPYVRGRLDLAHGVPFIPGSNLDLVSIYVPVGAQVTSFLLDGQPYSIHDALDRHHEVLSFRVALNPGVAKRISIEWQLAKHLCARTTPLLTTNSLYNAMKVRYTFTGSDSQEDEKSCPRSKATPGQTK